MTNEEEQEYYHDDANVMYEMIRQFIEGLSGDETKEKLDELVNDAVEYIHHTAPLMQKDYISELLWDAIDGRQMVNTH